ncbi:MAG: UV DNA damage repair endonuclease UvsE [Actinomycetota bacterium]|nr:UV DNA damage repair endonuclease UvsE [Actinomycetota bacterium]
MASGVMRLGFAVKVLGGGGLPSHDARRWRSEPHLRVSLEYIDAIFDYLEDTDINMYRMSSSLAPYASHPDMLQFRHQVDDCLDKLGELGARARTMGLRLSMHPGQYTVLNSTDDMVVQAAVEELEVHTEILDAMGLGPEAVIVLHVGGRSGGVGPSLERFERGFARLSERARARLILENDDRSFSLSDVLTLAGRIDRPVVWDVLHHYCYDPHLVPHAEALTLALDTWPDGVRPKIHFSSSRGDVIERKQKREGRTVSSVEFPPMRAHADLIDPVAFATFMAGVGASARPFDVMLEAKAKDLALIRLRDQLTARRLSMG